MYIIIIIILIIINSSSRSSSNNNNSIVITVSVPGMLVLGYVLVQFGKKWSAAFDIASQFLKWYDPIAPLAVTVMFEEMIAKMITIN